MADAAEQSDTARAEKIAAARKRFEELKQQQQTAASSTTTTVAATSSSTTSSKKKKAGKKSKTKKVEGSETPDRADTESPAIKDEDVKSDNDEVAKEINPLAGVDSSHHEQTNAALHEHIANLQAEIAALKVENAALTDSLATANAKIQLDASTISVLQQDGSNNNNNNNNNNNGNVDDEETRSTGTAILAGNKEEYYKNLEAKFSREAQERYLLERDYASLARTHENVVNELERLKNAIVHDRDEVENQQQQQVTNRLGATSSSLFRTAQGFSAAVVKGVTGSANAVIETAGTSPNFGRRISALYGGHNGGSGRGRAGSGGSEGYADVDLYDDALPEEDEEGDDETTYQVSGGTTLQQKQKAAEEQENELVRLQGIEAVKQRDEWLKTEITKWKGFQIDLSTSSVPIPGVGPVFEA
ncbi:hypothetical protein V1514DRAFT_275729 [Lipomyces japonicus]|uniref:uncharacterized protein n=1 Tax=Lipomyces japonicus TaxID=56871 RepID=UPI0034CE9D42